MGRFQGRNGSQGIVYVDTHAAIWLRSGDPNWVTPKGLEMISRCDLLVSPMVLFELQLMAEIRRIQETPDDLLAALHATAAVAVCDLPWESVIRAAAAEQWTRDPFDRLIVANARGRQAPLPTAERNILTNYSEAFC
jgi:PIN domain nuclease of toxin-antitoxin system